MTKIHVLLIFGGESSEHDVSIASAHNVYAALDDAKYDISLCLIDREGKWWLVESVEGGHSGGFQLLPDLGQGQFIVLPEMRTIRPDVLMPILHGANGEDGTVQGLARLLHIPVAGPSLLSAALTMDKDVTKRLLASANLPVVKGIVWLTHERQPLYQDIASSLGPVMFIKPANAGSSVGVSKATDSDSFVRALKLAAEHDEKVLIESSINAREIEVAVLGNDELTVSVPGEIIPGEEFYSYEDKYSPASTSRAVIPAEISEEQTALIRRYATEAYRATLGHGMSRVDFFLDKEDGSVYFNEINSIPGFTNISMYPKLLRHDGMSYPALIDRLIELALDK